MYIYIASPWYNRNGWPGVKHRVTYVYCCRHISQWHAWVMQLLHLLQPWWWLLLYSAVLRSRPDSLRSHVILHEWLAFYSAFFWISTEVVYIQRWYETAAVSAQVLCTPYNHAPCHFMESHIRKVYVCLAVTCHLHFWQNDRDLLRATAVTRGWNGYRNKSQHRKLRKFSRRSCRDSNLRPFSHGALTTELSRSLTKLLNWLHVHLATPSVLWQAVNKILTMKTCGTSSDRHNYREAVEVRSN